MAIPLEPLKFHARKRARLIVKRTFAMRDSLDRDHESGTHDLSRSRVSPPLIV